jgi:hypothetical protein
MAKQWTPEEVRIKVEMLTQSISPYMTNRWAEVERMTRVNMVAEEWSDEVLKGVIEKGPMTEPLPKLCAEELAKREAVRKELRAQIALEETERNAATRHAEALAETRSGNSVAQKALYWARWAVVFAALGVIVGIIALLLKG